MITRYLILSGQGVVSQTVCAESVRHYAEGLMDQAAEAQGAAAIIPLVTAAEAFRALEDGASAARAEALLGRARVNYALEQLFEELLRGFESSLEAALAGAPMGEDDPVAAGGPKKSVPYFKLAVREIDASFNDGTEDPTLRALDRFARRFLEAAGSRDWHRWDSDADPLPPEASSPEARAGARLFEAWLGLLRRDFGGVTAELSQVLELTRTDRENPAKASWERSGRLHYFSGLSLLLPRSATMKELQDATLHFRDALSALERAGKAAPWIRDLLAVTYDRLAREHTEGGSPLRTHYENQAFQARLDLEPLLPRARVVRQPGTAGGLAWLARFWRGEC